MTEQEKLANLYTQIDPALKDELEATAEREGRKQRVIIERALTDYIAKSKADAAKPDTRKAKATA